MGAVGIVGAGAVACGSALPHPPYIAQTTGSLVAVASEPPPARVEYVPPRPRVADAVWVDGEWAVRRGRWAWKLGRWVVAPQGTRFSPWVAVRSDDGVNYFAPGVFRDAQGQAVAEPPPLAVASADSAAVVDAEGFNVLTGRTMRPTPTAGAASATGGEGEASAPIRAAESAAGGAPAKGPVPAPGK